MNTRNKTSNASLVYHILMKNTMQTIKRNIKKNKSANTSGSVKQDQWIRSVVPICVHIIAFLFYFFMLFFRFVYLVLCFAALKIGHDHCIFKWALISEIEI